MPWMPPGGTKAFVLPALLLSNAVVPVATFAGDLAFGLYLLAAELLAVFGNAAEVALERHSRGRVLDMARRAKREAWAERRLANLPSYAFTARLARFLGHALLVAGVAWLAFREHFVARHAVDAPLPWNRLALVMVIVFGVTFLINDVVVRLLTVRRPNRALLALMPALEVLRFGLAPLRIPLVWIVRLVFRVNLDAAAPSPREEILETVEEGEREGSFTREEADMIGSIIGMDDSLAKDVLTPRADMVMIQAEADLDEVMAVIREKGYSRMPVYGKDRDDVIGVLYVHDLLDRLVPSSGAEAPRDLKLTDLLRKPLFVPENKPINDLLRDMRAHQVHMAIVIDEFDGTVGLVTIEDLIEEIVGEIHDEYDEEPPPEPPPQKIGGGPVHVEGRTPIEEVNRQLDVALPIEEDFETMSGLVFHQLGKVPDEGEHVDIDGVRLTVVEADERTVLSLRVEVAVPDAPKDVPG